METGEDGVCVVPVHECPACGSKRLEDYLATNLTTFFFPVPKEMIKRVKREPFSLRICIDCSHIAQKEIRPALLALIYDEFYAHYNLDTSPEFQEVYGKRTADFLGEMAPRGGTRSVLDIGCGEGTFFPLFDSLGYECFGIEPSKKGEIAQRKNPNAKVWVQSFDTWEPTDFNGGFDVILMNWVLEHIADPSAFFERLKSCVRPGTRLVIQVPDICYYIANSLSLFYVHEHINYFTPQTLRVLLERKGFSILDEKHGDCASLLMCGEYTGVEKRRGGPFSAQVDAKKQFVAETEGLKANVANIFTKYEKVVFYGVGLLAFWISEFCLSESDCEKIELVDDNTYYHGKFVPSFNSALTVFPEGYVLEGALILISASPSYHDRIRLRIKRRFSGSYDVATIIGGQVVVERSAQSAARVS